MKKYLVFIAVILMPVLGVYAQEEGDVYKYWIELKDKEVDKYSVDNPSVFLTQKAVDRRNKQSIEITEQDFPVNEEYVKTLMEETEAKVLARSRWFNALIVETNDKKVYDEILELSFVKGGRFLGEWHNQEKETAEDDNSTNFDYDLSEFMEYLKSVSFDSKSSSTDDESFSTMVKRNYGRSFNQIKQLNGVKMHDLGFKGEGMTIAVLDAGFSEVDEMNQFDTLEKYGRILGVRDFVDFDSNVYEDDEHGMNVLSCMGGNKPGSIVGTAPEASYWLLRTEDGSSEYPVEEANWVVGAEFADSIGADIINSSLGYTTFDDEQFKRTYKDLTGKVSIASIAADIAVSKGILVCVSAGNEGDDKWKYIGAPADAENVISVGGVNSSGNHSDFSSIGPTPDGRIKPTVCAKASNAVVASGSGSTYSDGTSFASPILCGMVACLWQANPTKTYKEIMDAMIQSSTHYNNTSELYGYGVPDFYLAHTLLGDNKRFNYSKDQLLSPNVSRFSSYLSVRLYSASDQTVSITVSYEKNEGAKKKVVFSEEKSVKKGDFSLLTITKPFKKRKTGTFYLVVKTADGTEFKRKLDQGY
jgi:serine protease AprX